jgi:catechol 2,3-dioxygenase-like lactoylglutathione lyase family enzyme
VGIVVDDLAAATAFFVELGLNLQGEGLVEDGWVDRVVGLEGVRVEFAMMGTPDGHGRLELIKFHAPPGRGGDRPAPSNTRASAMSVSRSTTSTPSSPACEPTARSRRVHKYDPAANRVI